VLLKGDLGWKNLPFLIFGISGIAVGLTTVILPETLGKNLPNTIDEAENFGILRRLKRSKK
jgi:MFS transporter, OCT family, solute carrier family 22 (organic cation transporter), member 4/5